MKLKEFDREFILAWLFLVIVFWIGAYIFERTVTPQLRACIAGVSSDGVREILPEGVKMKPGIFSHEEKEY